MPHFTLNFDPVSGPLVDLFVGVSKAREGALKLASQPVPAPMRVRGLVDTGASGVCIDPSVITTLGLVPTGASTCYSPTTGAKGEIKNTYDIALYLVHSSGHFLPSAVPAIESVLAVQGFEVLIGRDILSNCLLVYDGPNGTFALAF